MHCSLLTQEIILGKRYFYTKCFYWWNFVKATGSSQSFAWYLRELKLIIYDSPQNIRLSLLKFQVTSWSNFYCQLQIDYSVILFHRLCFWLRIRFYLQCLIRVWSLVFSMILVHPRQVPLILLEIIVQKVDIFRATVFKNTLWQLHKMIPYKLMFEDGISVLVERWRKRYWSPT